MKNAINMKSVIGLRRGPWLKQTQNAHRKSSQWKDQIKRRFIRSRRGSVWKGETNWDMYVLQKKLNILYTCEKLLPGELPSRTLPRTSVETMRRRASELRHPKPQTSHEVAPLLQRQQSAVQLDNPKLHYQLKESEMSLPWHFALSFRVPLRVRPQRWYVCPVFRCCWIGVADLPAEC